MSKKNADTQSGTDAETSTNIRAIQPRMGRVKQIRRLREKSTMTLRAAASVAGLAGDNTKAPKQGRLRQLKAVKQLAARLTKSVGQSETKKAVARPMQLRQLSARKTLHAAVHVVGVGPVTEHPSKTTLARTAQLRQFGAKKQLALKAEAK
ncbi:hypothetical protein CYFUS_004695 [Cystobacter fuscus]|uniref:Uncharacterized protein n=1 Tax=Cystobacter fuscus TaxID=43 RepID=A0A250J756_9BACT|nr:hypothetical protein [Cystobacter fuscus]ATB39251.1 hypothetical protein CYFUS_004695 [Cystobacter fuscus]